MKASMRLDWGAAGESFIRSKPWETAGPASRDQRTKRSTFAGFDPLTCARLGARFMLTFRYVLPHTTCKPK